MVKIQRVFCVIFAKPLEQGLSVGVSLAPRGHLETFLDVTAGRGFYWHLLGRG